jgi:vinculin
MPRALATIEKAADLLETACKEMNEDPFSQSGRDHLIAGSRAILQGTTTMLVTFDESQVRNLTKKIFNFYLTKRSK